MNNNKNKIVFDNLYNSIFEILKVDTKEVEETLCDFNIDIGKLDEENSNFIKDLKTKIKIEIGMQKAKEKSSILEKTKNMLKKIDDIEDFILKHLPDQEYKQLIMEFRNLNSIDNETKIKLLTEIQLLKLMEYLKKEKGNE